MAQVNLNVAAKKHYNNCNKKQKHANTDH